MQTTIAALILSACLVQVVVGAEDKNQLSVGDRVKRQLFSDGPFGAYHATKQISGPGGGDLSILRNGRRSVIPANPPLSGSDIIARGLRCSGEKLNHYDWCKSCLCWNGKWFCTAMWCHDWNSDVQSPDEGETPEVTEPEVETIYEPEIDVEPDIEPEIEPEGELEPTTEFETDETPEIDDIEDTLESRKPRPGRIYSYGSPVKYTRQKQLRPFRYNRPSRVYRAFRIYRPARQIRQYRQKRPVSAALRKARRLV